MATLTRSLEQPQSQTRDLHERPLKPVKWWATLGLIWLSLIAFSTARWLLGGHAHSTGVGPSHEPTFMTVWVRIMEVSFVVLAIAALYLAVIRPWRRDKRLSWDGIFVLACATIYWQ